MKKLIKNSMRMLLAAALVVTMAMPDLAAAMGRKTRGGTVFGPAFTGKNMAANGKATRTRDTAARRKADRDAQTAQNRAKKLAAEVGQDNDVEMASPNNELLMLSQWLPEVYDKADVVAVVPTVAPAPSVDTDYFVGRAELANARAELIKIRSAVESHTKLKACEASLPAPTTPAAPATFTVENSRSIISRRDEDLLLTPEQCARVARAMGTLPQQAPASTGSYWKAAALGLAVATATVAAVCYLSPEAAARMYALRRFIPAWVPLIGCSWFEPSIINSLFTTGYCRK